MTLEAGPAAVRAGRSRLYATVAVLVALLLGLSAALSLRPASALPATAPAVGLLTSPDGNGYAVVSAAGVSYAYGSDPRVGTLTDEVELSSPAVGSARAADGGSWLATRDGAVLAVGAAPALGGLAGRSADSPLSTIVATPSGRGYWLVTEAGRVAGFGDADVHGGLDTVLHSGRVVALAPTPEGRGYWLATSDGGVFAFGDVATLGSPQATNAERAARDPKAAAPRPVVDLLASPTGRGYLAVAEDGTTYAYGDAVAPGSLTGMQLTSPVVAAAAYGNGSGLWLLQRNGGVVALRAPFYGSVVDEEDPKPGTVLAPYFVGGAPTVDGAAGGLVAVPCTGGQNVIVVSALLARPVADLLGAAARDGVALCGTSSFRNSQQQIALRTRYCTDVFDPAATCSRPVALPGRSLHEQGLAVDFAADGRGYAWLAANAERFGLHHLAAYGPQIEPWHYSIDGG